MVKAVKGVLVTCDPTVKQIILHLNEQYKFIIEDLDDEHLFIDGGFVQLLKTEVEQRLEENTYKLQID
ncbi:TFIIH subunit TTDA/Tfb5 [Paraphysoderma sedebokerense]|nr:TFIIH subunit TTDA/Tfb5 [Paraphysoderma sedebokerense]